MYICNKKEIHKSLHFVKLSKKYDFVDNLANILVIKIMYKL